MLKVHSQETEKEAMNAEVFREVMQHWDKKPWKYETPCLILRCAIEFGNDLIHEGMIKSFLASFTEKDQYNANRVVVYVRDFSRRSVYRYAYTFS